MSGTLALAAAIAAMDRDALTALVLTRRPQAIANVSDPIGLALDLLRADSIERALGPRSRSELFTVMLPERSTEDQVKQMLAIGLLGLDEGEPVTLPEVLTSLTASLTQAGIETADLESADLENIAPERAAREAANLDSQGDDSVAAADPPSHADTASWYVAALTSVAIAAETLRALRARPGRMNRNNTVAVASLKVAAESTSISVQEVGYAVESLMAAGLLAPLEYEPVFACTPRGVAWLNRQAPERWVELAAPVFKTMPHPLRELLKHHEYGEALALLPHQFPLLSPSALAQISRFTELANHLGFVMNDALSEAARALLTGADGEAEALQLARRDMPAPAAGVYIQPDLSVVVPGPLSPEDEASLTALSAAEQTGIASTRRITEASLTELLERNSDIDATRSTLERLSLTGVPQPLEYMLTSIGGRIRNIIVHEYFGEAGRTRLEIAREDLRDTLLVDRSLHHLQLRPESNDRGDLSLISQLRSDHVFAALSDARYAASFPPVEASAVEPPVVESPAAGGNDDAVAGSLAGTSASGSSAGAGAAGSSAADAANAGTASSSGISPELMNLIDRVHESSHAEPSTGGLIRRLELAIKDRSTVRVTASTRGQTRVFTLLPTALDSGRLRATDAGADVERTLPVSIITSVE